MSSYRKAIVAFVVTLVVAGAAACLTQLNGPAFDWRPIVGAILSAFITSAGVYVVPNAAPVPPVVPSSTPGA